MIDRADRLLTPLKEANWWLLALMGALIASYALVMKPSILGALAVGGFAVLLLCIATYLWPVRVMQWMFFLLMWGSTQFRVRDETATLQGIADLQVLFQLGVSGAALAAAAVAMLTDAFPRTRLLLSEWLLAGFGLLAFMSLAWSSIPTVTAIRAVQVLILVFFIGVAVRVLGPSRALHALFVSAVCYTIIGVTIRLATGGGYQKIDLNGAVRFTWLYIHPIIAGTYAMSAALFLVVHSLYREGRVKLLSRVLPWMLVGVLLVVALATRSRGPVFAGIGGLGVLVFYKYSRPWVTAVALPALLAVGLSAWAVLPVLTEWLGTGAAAGSAAGAFLLRGEGLDGLLDLNGRVGLWTDLLPLFREKVFLGSGFLASREFILEYRHWASEAHNSLVQSLLDVGIIGTVFLWLAVVLTFVPFAGGKAASPTSRRARAIGITMLFFVVLNSMTTASFAGAPGYESLLAFTCIVAVAANRRGDPR